MTAPHVEDGAERGPALGTASRTLVAACALLIVFWNLGANDVWTENEALYADAVREMLESGNYLDIQFNDEPRLRKPPVTYWLAVIPAAFLGPTEWALRLPVALLTLASAWLTFLLGRELHGRRAGVYAGLAMLFSGQFIANGRYLSPEVPLTFFFLLGILGLVAGYRRDATRWILVGWIGLGLAAATKGLHFIALAFGIVALWVAAREGFRGRDAWRAVLRLGPAWGVPLSLVLGGAWYAYAALTHGDAFGSVQSDETLQRAFGFDKHPPRLSDLTFYPLVVLWGFLPYSLTAYHAFLHALADPARRRRHGLALLWIGTMWVVLTLMRGKIPTYFIQAHPALALLVGVMLAEGAPEAAWGRRLYIAGLALPALVLAAGCVWLVWLFDLGWLWLAVLVVPAAHYAATRDLRLQPFLAGFAFLFVWVGAALPRLEGFRPYDQIAAAVRRADVSTEVPLLSQRRNIRNLPYYLERRCDTKLEIDEIRARAEQEEILALVLADDRDRIGGEELWRGWIYWFRSESQIAKLVRDVHAFENGDPSGFAEFVLVHSRPEAAPPTAAPPRPWALLAVGDTGAHLDGFWARRGQGLVGRALARNEAARPADALVLLGDNFYPNGLEPDLVEARVGVNVVGPYCRFVELAPDWSSRFSRRCPPAERARPLPLHVVLGNHDHNLPESPRLQREAVNPIVANWLPPPEVVALHETGAGVSLVLLDSQRLIRRPRDADALRDALARSRGPWRILVSHHPVALTNPETDPLEPMADFRRGVTEAIRASGVSVHAVLSGHEHSLQLIAAPETGAALQVIAGGGSETSAVLTEHPGLIAGVESLGFARVDLARPDAERLEVSLFRTDWRGTRPVARLGVDLDGRVRELGD